jgi:hypothetical protein
VASGAASRLSGSGAVGREPRPPSSLIAGWRLQRMVTAGGRGTGPGQGRRRAGVPAPAAAAATGGGDGDGTSDAVSAVGDTANGSGTGANDGVGPGVAAAVGACDVTNGTCTRAGDRGSRKLWKA